MKYIAVLCILLGYSFKLYPQNINVSIGTDVPYQHYMGVQLNPNKSLGISYRTGMLVPPYSDAILTIIEKLGTDEIYINLLESSYDFGWMNSLGTYYKFSKNKSWYVGCEFRLDNLTADDSPAEIIEAATGIPVINTNPLGLPNPFQQDIEVKLGLKLYGLGLRFGKAFSISEDNKHHIILEISAYKYLKTTSTLTVNGNYPQELNKVLDDLLWEDVFKEYGYVGGIGIGYSYTF